MEQTSFHQKFLRFTIQEYAGYAGFVDFIWNKRFEFSNLSEDDGVI